MTIPQVKCQHCANDARYINELGEWLCSLCDMNKNWRSVRISDIPFLLSKLAVLMRARGPTTASNALNDVKELLWRKT